MLMSIIILIKLPAIVAAKDTFIIAVASVLKTMHVERVDVLSSVSVWNPFVALDFLFQLPDFL